MYQITGYTHDDSSDADPSVILEHEVGKMHLLVDRLKHFHPRMRTFGIVSDDARRYATEAIKEFERTGKEPAPEIQAELDRLDAWPGYVTLLDQPDHILMHARRQNEAVIADPTNPGMLFIQLSAKGNGPSATLKRQVQWQDAHRGSLTLTLPMTDKHDLWFDDWHLVKEMLAVLLGIWDFSWLTVEPWAYSGRALRLFPNRAGFGWMGYTPATLSDPGDALALVEPLCGGTFMLLQKPIMTLREPEIEACNRAEAYLADRDMLPIFD